MIKSQLIRCKRRVLQALLLNNPTLDAMGKRQKGIIPSQLPSPDEFEWAHPECPKKIRFETHSKKLFSKRSISPRSIRVSKKALSKIF